MKVAFDSPHNAQVLAYLARDMKPEGLTSMSRGEYKGYYYAWTHPDLSDQFWTLAGSLTASQWVLYERAVLIHPQTGIIFGFSGGTSTIALRLPPDALTEAFTDSEYGHSVKYKPRSLNASEIGDDWAFINPFRNSDRARRWFQAAHDYAGTLE